MATRSRDGLYLRGGVWWCRVPACPGGPKVRRSTKCTDRVAARLAKAELERQSASPADYAANRASVADAVTAYLDAIRRKHRSEATLGMYEQKCGHIRRLLGDDRKLATITASLVDQYIGTRERENAKPHTIKKELARLHGMLKEAKRRGWYTGDLSSVMPSYSPQYEPRTRALSLAELPKLLAELRHDRLAHVAFVVATGARLAESYRARREHYRADGAVFIEGTKTKKSKRVIPVAPVFAPLMALALKYAPGKDRLFPMWGNANRDIKAACARAGIKAVTWNDLRRTNATILRNAGVPVSDVADLLGHVDSRMVETVYGQQTTESLSASIGRAFGAQSAQAEPLPNVLPEKIRGERMNDTSPSKPRVAGSSPAGRAAKQRGNSASGVSASSPQLADLATERHAIDTAVRASLRAILARVLVDHGADCEAWVASELAALARQVRS